MEDEMDDEPKLSASTLAALQSFLSEREAERAQQEAEDEEAGDGSESLQIGGASGCGGGVAAAAAGGGGYEMVKEDWGMSQFWYDAHTSKTVADELWFLSGSSASTRQPIACIACPSLYTQLKKTYPEAQVCLFEYDRRFSKYGADFVFYDYNQPLDVPFELHQAFHVVVADPPYLVLG